VMVIIEVVLVIIERVLTVGLLFGVPWALARWLLRRARPGRERRVGLDGLDGLDGPGRLLALAVATLPEDRREWGTAMAAELDQLVDRSERWWFALGALRVALLPPPRGDRRLVLVVTMAAIGAVVAARLVASRAVPGLDVFVPTFAGVLGLAVTAAAVRSGRAPWDRWTPWRRTGLLLGTLVPAAVVAAVAAAVWFARAYPSVGQATWPPAEAALAVALAVAAALALAPPPALVPSPLAARVAALGGVLLGLLVVVAARSPGAAADVVAVLVLFGPPVTAGMTAGVVAAFDRSFSSGIVAAAWTLLLETPLLLAVWLPTAAAVYDTHGLLLDGEGGGPIGTNLADFAWILLLMALLVVPSSVVGAAIGTSTAAPTGSRPEAGPPPGASTS
jgi:hypothetical protein